MWTRNWPIWWPACDAENFFCNLPPQTQKDSGEPRNHILTMNFSTCPECGATMKPGSTLCAACSLSAGNETLPLQPVSAGLTPLPGVFGGARLLNAPEPGRHEGAGSEGGGLTPHTEPVTRSQGSPTGTALTLIDRGGLGWSGDLCRGRRVVRCRDSRSSSATPIRRRASEYFGGLGWRDWGVR